MGAVDLAPAVVAVGGQPEVGFVEVAEQQELAHPPRRGQPQHVLHGLAADLAARRPRLVLPAQREPLRVPAVPRLPRHVVTIGREGSEDIGPSLPDPSGDDTRRPTTNRSESWPL